MRPRGQHMLWWIGQDKVNKEIMITHTEFLVKVTKSPMSIARKEMRDDLADESENHAFCGFSGSINSGKSNMSGRILSSVTCAANLAAIYCRSGLRFECSGASRSPAC